MTKFYLIPFKGQTLMTEDIQMTTTKKPSARFHEAAKLQRKVGATDVFLSSEHRLEEIKATGDKALATEFCQALVKRGF